MTFRRARATRGPGKRIGSLLGIVALAISSLFCAVVGGADDGSPGAIRFRGHMALGFSEGEFKRWRITEAMIDEEHPERSSVALMIDLTSLDTGNDTRDRHLRSADFLDAERYPTAAVRVSDIKLEDAAHFTANVQLDLHGRSHSFPMQFVVVDRAARRITGETTLRRSDFGVGATGSFFNPLRVDDEVHIMVDVSVPAAEGSTHG